MTHQNRLHGVLKYLLQAVRNSAGFYRLHKLRQTKGVLQADVQFYDTRAMMRVVYPYGLYAYPQKAWEAAAVTAASSPLCGYVVGLMGPEADQPALEEGEVILYNGQKSSIHMKANGQIVMKAGGFVIEGNVEIKGSLSVVPKDSQELVQLKVDGDLSAQGHVSASEVRDDGGTLGVLRQQQANHRHTGYENVMTSPPIILS